MADTLAEAIFDVLAADATLLTTLTGGVYLVDAALDRASDHAGKHPINPTDTEDAFETLATGSVPRLKPCAAVYTSSDVSVQSGYGRQPFVHVVVWERTGYANCRTARERIRTLCHGVKFSVGSKSFEVYHENDMTNVEDPIMEGGVGDRPPSMEKSIYSGLGAW